MRAARGDREAAVATSHALGGSLAHVLALGFCLGLLLVALLDLGFVHRFGSRTGRLLLAECLLDHRPVRLGHGVCVGPSFLEQGRNRLLQAGDFGEIRLDVGIFGHKSGMLLGEFLGERKATLDAPPHRIELDAVLCRHDVGVHAEEHVL